MKKKKKTTKKTRKAFIPGSIPIPIGGDIPGVDKKKKKKKKKTRSY